MSNLSLSRPFCHSRLRLGPTISKREMAVAKGVELNRYMGRWCLIASLPSRFQPRDEVNSRATYTARDDGSVHVLNETWSGGKRGSIEGTAYRAELSSDEAKFKVKFYVPPFWPVIPAVGDYWVLFVDDDYRNALIGEPMRKYLWILCRQTHMDEEVYNKLVQKAIDEGYDVSKLHRTPQSDPPPEEGPNDTKGIWWIKSLLGR